MYGTKDQDVEHETEAGVDDDEGGEHIDLYEVSCKVAEMVRLGSESDHAWIRLTVLLPCVYAGGQDCRHQAWGGLEKTRCYKTTLHCSI